MNIIEELIETGNETLLNEAMKQLPLVFEIKDEQMNNLFTNQLGLDMMGFKKSEVIGKNSLDFIPKIYHEQFIESTRKLFRDKKAKGISRLLDANNQVHTIASTIKVFNVAGKNYSLHAWFDITDPEEITDYASHPIDVHETKKPVSDKLMLLYKDMLINFLVKEEKFKSCELSLLNMSIQLKIPQKYISHIINHELGISFSDFVNYLRLRHFNEIQNSSENNIYTKETIAQMCGFASPATFYRAQKKFKDHKLSFAF